MTHVLVTGGAGFIGSHSVDALVASGHRVRVLDNLHPRVHGRRVPGWLNPDAEYVAGDASRPQDVAEALRGVEAVVHLAAYQDYQPDFSTFMHVNAESAALLFEAIVADRDRRPVERIVFASSQAVAGEGRYVCRDCHGLSSVPTLAEQLEDRALAEALASRSVVPRSRPLEQLERGVWDVACVDCGEVMDPVLIGSDVVSPGTAYAVSKHAVELLAGALGRRYGIETVCLRYTYVQGPRNSVRNAYSGATRRFALAIRHRLPITLYEDGRQLRDFVNVADVVRANAIALEADVPVGSVLNVGGGRAVTVWDVARMVADAFGVDADVRVPGAFRLGDTRHTVCDIGPLERLGWRPTVPVEVGVADYVAWLAAEETDSDVLDSAEREMLDAGVVRSAAAGARAVS